MLARTALVILASARAIVGIISFALSQKEPLEHEHAFVRIQVGLDGNTNDSLKNAGGHVPEIRLYDEYGHEIGRAPGHKHDKVGSGSMREVKIHQSVGSQAVYTMFSATHNDAICVAFASITWTDSLEWSVAGDLGTLCKANWYYSNVYVGLEEGKKRHKANCFWIDEDGSSGIQDTGFTVYWPHVTYSNIEGAFKDLKADKSMNETERKRLGEKHDSFICESGPPFNVYQNCEEHQPYFWQDGKPPVGWKDWNGVPSVNKRDATARLEGIKKAQEKHRDRLVKTDEESHSIARICGSETSLGPDIVNTLEGLFCRMSDKTLWPVCSSDVEVDCFDSDVLQLRETGITAEEQQAYRRVDDWVEENRIEEKRLKRDQANDA
ncbi:hypothetical protein F4778DRAFT_748325 [Xylariomycetidae sp. FL2044]|nr:hypothetical protein F4778DRAFT_748325 [Xylariomycetidae sp. FL2044]